MDNKDVIGKEFIYVSKYGGRLRLRCKEVSVQESILLDPESEEFLKWRIDKSPKGTGKMEKPQVTDSDKYIARRTNRYFITEEGNSYEEEFCYIIDK